jgi:5-methylcytosine-specific restriction protein A
MSCYLLTWKPEVWPKEKFDEYYLKYKNEVISWSCGNTKKIIAGDSFFLIKKGSAGKGIIGSGEIVSSPYSDTHYDAQNALTGKTALFIDIKFDYLSHSNAAIPIRRDELATYGLEHTIWNSQGSGQTIPVEIEDGLTDLWKNRIGSETFVYPDELPPTGIFEGAKSTIEVNSYERNPEARKKCLDKWGYNCAVCRFHFELYYGTIGKNYIHVHHLKPISSIGAEYEIDPENDLRPVCPNCHAMLHREKPPLSIEQLKKLVSEYG